MNILHSPVALACAALLTTLPLATRALELPTPTVVVTATRHAMLALDAPAALSVVTRRDLEARAADDLFDALRGEPGITLQGRTIGGRKVLGLRGLDSKHTLFLIDGRRVGASDGIVGHSDFQYDWIPVEDIERIEIVRGPLSVLYGSEAMGGVINVITRPAGDRWRTGARVDGGVATGQRGGDSQRASLRIDGPLAERLSLVAGAADSRRSALASIEDPRISELEGHRKSDIWLGLGWRPAGTQRIDLDLRAGEETRVADARERSGRKRYHETVNALERSLASLGWSGDFDDDRQSARLRAYESRLDVENRRSAGVAINPPQRLTERVLEGQWRIARGSHAVTTGFEARNELLADPGMPGGESLAEHRSLFLQDEWALQSTLNATLGVRHDRHSLYGNSTSPRAYLVWRGGPQWTLKGGVSSGFKAPNLKQIVPGARPEGPNSFLGNPGLKPERSRGGEVVLAYAEGARQAQLTLYQQRVTDLIDVRLVSPGSVPGTGTYTYENISRARLRGLEASLVQPLGAGFTAQLAASKLSAEDGQGRALERRPSYSASARLDWQRQAWRAGLRIERSGPQWLPATSGPAQRASALTLAGAYAARTLAEGLELSVGVDNLGNLRPVEKSALYTHAEAPRTWRMAISGQW